MKVELLHVEIIMTNEKQNQLKAIMRTKLIPINIKKGKKEQNQKEFMNWVKSIENIQIKSKGTLQERIKELLIDFKSNP